MWLEHGGRREHESSLHSQRIGLERLRKELPELRELRDLLDCNLDLCRCQALVGKGGADVLVPRELRVEPRACFQKCLNISVHFDAPLGRGYIPGDQFEERALARAVAPDDSDATTCSDL